MIRSVGPKFDDAGKGPMKAVKDCRACGESNGVRKSGHVVVMFWGLPAEYSLFLYLRAEFAHNCKKIRSPKYKSPLIYTALFLIRFSVNAE